MCCPDLLVTLSLFLLFATKASLVLQLVLLHGCSAWENIYLIVYFGL